MKNNRLDAIINIIIVVSTVVAVGYYSVVGPDPVGVSVNETFDFFTTDSNVLVMLIAMNLVTYAISVQLCTQLKKRDQKQA